MKKLLVAFVLMTSLSSMVVSDAYARRFGGRSLGRQSSNVSRMAPMQRTQPARPMQQQQSAEQSGQKNNTSRPPTRSSRWGMLGGALLGLGLGALLAHMGITGGFANLISILLIIGVLVFVFAMFKRMRAKRQEPAYQQAGYSGGFGDAADMENDGRTPKIGSRLLPTSAPEPSAFQASPSAFQTQDAAPVSSGMDGQPLTWDIPADFEVASFIRAAKAYYIRMQAAWDKADIDDIHEFTTPEMFAEMKLQLQERGPSANITDVVTLDAELLGIENVAGEYLASVKYTGTVKEDGSAIAEPFTEVWNLTRPASQKEGWVLAGVQQLS